MRLITQDEFITRAKEVWGDRYDLSEAVYVNRRSPVTIVCQKHGRFQINAGNFLDGSGCRRCGYESNGKAQRLTTEQFILKARHVHGWEYDYSLVDYNNSNEKVKIVCKEHGVFLQEPNSHLAGRGCPECAKKAISINSQYTKDEYIARAKEGHGERYDYSLVEYKGCRTKIRLICPEHGEFTIQPYQHLNGVGCPKCKAVTIGNLKRSDKDTFVRKAVEIHGDKYDYTKVNYINALEKVEIVCGKHGGFWQTPASHLSGQGCPKCNSSIGENEIRRLLSNEGIEFIPQHKFVDCKHKNPLPFDFFLPKHNICIEFQGDQHFRPVKRFGGEEAFKVCQLRDQIKRDYCASHGIRLVEIRYDQDIEEELKKQLQL